MVQVWNEKDRVLGRQENLGSSFMEHLVRARCNLCYVWMDKIGGEGEGREGYVITFPLFGSFD